MQASKKSGMIGLIVGLTIGVPLELLHVTDLSWPLMLLASAGVGLMAGLALYGVRKAFKF